MSFVHGLISLGRSHESLGSMKVYHLGNECLRVGGDRATSWCLLNIEAGTQATEMAQQVKTLVDKTDALSLISRAHTVEGEN